MLTLLGGVRAAVWFGLMLLFLSIAGLQTWKLDRLNKQLDRLEQRTAAKERSYYKTIFGMAYDYHVKESDHKDYVDQLLADLADGNRRMRQRFSCPSGPTEGGDGGEGRGLLTEDGEFLIREAARADSIVRQLRLCQQTIEQYQELNKD